jgi:Chemotaxis signal transduction protein
MNSVDRISETLLRKRAEEYRSRGLEDKHAGMKDYLLICSGSLRCALELKCLVSMLPMPELTIVPNMPKAYLGVFAARGVLHEAFSLPVLLNESTVEHASMVLVRDLGGEELGLAVSEMLGIEPLPAECKSQVSDPHWPECLAGKLADDIYLLNVDILVDHLKKDG